MNKVVREEIKQSLRKSLYRHVSRFKYKNIQPLDLLIPKERKIRSLVGGLETSMGTTVWEPIAKTLAKNNGFEVITEKILMPKPFPQRLRDELDALITLREDKLMWVPISKCIERLKAVSQSVDKSGVEYVKPASGTGVDIRLKKEGKEYAFDTKTVQPNIGSIKSFNKQILEWYAYAICKNPSIELECKIAYPYNPHTDDFWSYTPHTSLVLKPHEDAVVEDEFWDFLSGETDTYKNILNIFSELATEGFGDELSAMIVKINES